MKTLWSTISILLFIHFLALLGLVGWLYANDRLDESRINRVKEMLSMTIAEEKAKEEEKAQQLAAMEAEAREQARFAHISEGTQTMADRIAAEKTANEATLMRQDRLRKEIAALHTMLAHAEAFTLQQSEQIEQQRAELDEMLAQAKGDLEKEDFKRASDWIQQLKPKQAKEIFKEYMAQQRTDEVVNLLASMTERTAGDILTQFKTPEEIEMAAELITQLKKRSEKIQNQPRTAEENGGL